MVSLWEQLDGKDVQRSQVPILVGDLRAAHQTVAAAQGALAAHEEAVKTKGKETAGDKKKATLLRDRLSAALEGARDVVRMVDVVSMSAPDYEALTSRHITADGDTNLEALLPELVAESCVDEELRDPARWAEQLARPVWTLGEKLDLRARLMGLNMHVPSGGLGKG